MNPTDFVWTREPTTATLVGPGHEAETVDLLVHRPTRYHFKFDVQQPQGSLWAFYNPGPEGVPRRDHAGTWEYVWSYFVGWLDRVKAEHEAPDLWATLQQQPALMVGDDVENTPFTPEELLQVTAQLNEVKETVRATLELEPGQIDRIETQLDYLTNRGRRAGATNRLAQHARGGAALTGDPGPRPSSTDPAHPVRRVARPRRHVRRWRYADAPRRAGPVRLEPISEGVRGGLKLIPSEWHAEASVGIGADDRWRNRSWARRDSSKPAAHRCSATRDLGS